MGVIQRQSIKATITSYLGVIVGYINISILFPFLFSAEQIGLITFLMSVTTLASQVGMMGISRIIIRFRKPLQRFSRSKFLKWVLTLPSLGLTSVAIILYLAKDWIIENNPGQNKEFLVQFYPYLIPMLFAYSLFMLMNAYSSSLQRIVVPSLLENVLYKVIILIGCILIYLDWINFNHFVGLHIVPYVVFGIFLIFYVQSLEKKESLESTKQTPIKRGSLLKFGMLSSLTGIGDRLMGNMDNLMITALLGLSDTGIYKLAFTIAVVVELPMRSVGKIAAPIIANAWQSGNVEEIKKILQKSASNLLAMGGFIFLIINSNTYGIFEIIPNGDVYKAGIGVIILITFAKLFSLSSGINSQIIANSKHYYFNFISLLTMAGIGFVTNYIFINLWGIEGAAFATLISIIFNNLLITLFMYWKEKIHPYTKKWFINYLIIGTILIAQYFVPNFENPFIDIIIRSGIIASIYLPTIYMLNMSDEINSIVDKLLSKFN